MLNDKTYKIVFALSLVLGMFLIAQNYNIKEKIVHSKAKLNLTEKAASNREIKLKEFGFTSSIEAVNTRKEIKINNLSSKNDSKEAIMEMNICGDISVAKNILEDIKKKDNYQRINNIKISRDENNNTTTKVNMEFIKNK